MEWNKNSYGNYELKIANPYRPKQKVTLYNVGQGLCGNKWTVMGEFDSYISKGFDTAEEAMMDAERRYAECDHTDVFMDFAHC